MYKNLVEQSGGEETGFKVQNVKERLQSHFWDKLCFFSPKKSNELSTVKKHLAKTYIRLCRNYKERNIKL